MPIDLIYPSGQGSLFSTHARQSKLIEHSNSIDTIELSNKLKCVLAGYLIEVGEILTAHNAGNGFWAISFPKRELRLFVVVNTHDLNQLAGFEMVKEE